MSSHGKALLVLRQRPAAAGAATRQYLLGGESDARISSHSSAECRCKTVGLSGACDLPLSGAPRSSPPPPASRASSLQCPHAVVAGSLPAVRPLRVCRLCSPCRSLTIRARSGTPVHAESTPRRPPAAGGRAQTARSPASTFVREGPNDTQCDFEVGTLF